MAEQYRFPQPLHEGVIHSRPNRFIMLANVNGEERKLHCPATGSIGGLKFRETPCLASLSDDKERSTQGTVEAISLNPPSDQMKHWIGIDQMRANDYVDFYLRRSLLKKMTGEVHGIQREVRVEGSRLDFLINGSTYLEVKTPLHMLDPKYADHQVSGELTSFGRTMRHFGAVGDHAAAGGGILLLCFLYDAKRFRVPETTQRTAAIKEAAEAATRQGMENWQVNFEVDREGVRLLDLFRLDLF
ncbi:MAG: DNA/RNA nuclease SfsA [Methanomassiliicoccales archaeon]